MLSSSLPGLAHRAPSVSSYCSLPGFAKRASVLLRCVCTCSNEQPPSLEKSPAPDVLVQLLVPYTPNRRRKASCARRRCWGCEHLPPQWTARTLGPCVPRSPHNCRPPLPAPRAPTNPWHKSCSEHYLFTLLPNYNVTPLTPSPKALWVARESWQGHCHPPGTAASLPASGGVPRSLNLNFKQN